MANISKWMNAKQNIDVYKRQLKNMEPDSLEVSFPVPIRPQLLEMWFWEETIQEHPLLVADLWSILLKPMEKSLWWTEEVVNSVKKCTEVKDVYKRQLLY